MATITEDYKEKLKEALNSDNTDYEVVRWIEQNYPELKEKKESEDEKIRKALVELVHDTTGDSLWVDYDVHKEDAITWLEREGEHANFRNAIQVGDKVTRNEDGVLVNLSQLNRVAKKQELEKQGEQKPNTQHSTEWSVSDFRTWQYIVSDVLTKKDGIGQYLDSGECKKIAKYMQEEWSKKLSVEQMPKELLKGEDYGIDGLYHAISILEKTLGKVDGYQSDDGILEHKCAISAVKKLYEQKPWSEEDETRLTNIIIMLKEGASLHFNKKDITKAVDWLKSLKDRVRSKQEWSENDKYNHNIILYLLNNECVGNADKRIAIEWFKSLSPQNHWKPSDEQIKALETTLYTNMSRNDERYSVLSEFVAELKKQKG